MAAELEKIIVDADLRQIQSLPPDLRYQRFNFRTRLDYPIIGAEFGLPWQGQGAPIEFAVWRQRQRVKPHKICGNHKFWELAL